MKLHLGTIEVILHQASMTEEVIQPVLTLRPLVVEDHSIGIIFIIVENRHMGASLCLTWLARTLVTQLIRPLTEAVQWALTHLTSNS